MLDPLIHETLYRGEEAMARLAGARIVLCGAGALGAEVALRFLLARAREE